MSTIAFVDIDGVLNTPQTWGARGVGAVEAVRVKVLDDFCRAHRAEVVISSSWRMLHSLEELRELLELQGLTVLVRDVTPVLHDQRRFEILAWLREHAPSAAWVAFDDDRDAEIVGHFVHIEGSAGLTRDHTARASALLEMQGATRPTGGTDGVGR